MMEDYPRGVPTLSDSSAASSSSEKYGLRRTSDSLMNLLSREESVVNPEGGGFYSKYEPREVLGR